MKKYLYLCLAVVGIAVFASCKSQKAVVASYSDLNGEWSVVELNGKKLDPADSKQLIVIDVARNHLSGNAGCNRMNGNIEYSEARKNIIKFPQVATTRMACPDLKGEQEAQHRGQRRAVRKPQRDAFRRRHERGHAAAHHGPDAEAPAEPHGP